eukprot:4263767-Amphidinium_carterae.1
MLKAPEKGTRTVGKTIERTSPTSFRTSHVPVVTCATVLRPLNVKLCMPLRSTASSGIKRKMVNVRAILQSCNPPACPVRNSHLCTAKWSFQMAFSRRPIPPREIE